MHIHKSLENIERLTVWLVSPRPICIDETTGAAGNHEEMHHAGDYQWKMTLRLCCQTLPGGHHGGYITGDKSDHCYTLNDCVCVCVCVVTLCTLLTAVKGLTFDLENLSLRLIHPNRPISSSSLILSSLLLTSNVKLVYFFLILCCSHCISDDTESLDVASRLAALPLASLIQWNVSFCLIFFIWFPKKSDTFLVFKASVRFVSTLISTKALFQTF